MNENIFDKLTKMIDEDIENDTKMFECQINQYLQETTKLIKENQRLKETVDGLSQENTELKEIIEKAITLLQLIQMNDEIDWGDINVLIHILKGDDGTK